ncbi:MAG: hypothetical protein ACOYLR_10840 [Chlorobium sp.]
MQHTVTINIPERFEPQIKRIKDLDLFVSTITIDAQQTEPRLQHQQLAETAQKMLHNYTTNAKLTCFTALDGGAIV